MNTTRTVGWALALALGAASGCSHESGERAAVSTAPGTTGETATQPQARGQTSIQPQAPSRPHAPSAPSPSTNVHYRDAAAALLTAADQLPLDEPRRGAVRTHEDNLRVSGREIASAFRMLHADLAVQVRAGAIDSAKIQADESVLTSAVQAHTMQEIDALNGLHAILDPAERETAISEVRSAEPGRTEEQAMSAQEHASQRLDRLTRELGLDHDQQQRVSALLSAQPVDGPAYRADIQQRFDDVLNGFSGDNFDARTVIQASGPSPAEMAHQLVQNESAFLSQLVAILRPDQREKLATKIEGRAL